MAQLASCALRGPCQLQRACDQRPLSATLSLAEKTWRSVAARGWRTERVGGCLVTACCAHITGTVFAFCLPVCGAAAPYAAAPSGPQWLAQRRAVPCSSREWGAQVCSSFCASPLLPAPRSHSSHCSTARCSLLAAPLLCAERWAALSVDPRMCGPPCMTRAAAMHLKCSGVPSKRSERTCANAESSRRASDADGLLLMCSRSLSRAS